MESNFERNTSVLKRGERVVLFNIPGEMPAYNPTEINPYVNIPDETSLDVESWEIVVGTVEDFGLGVVENRAQEAIDRTFKGKTKPSRYDRCAFVSVRWDGRGYNTYFADPMDSELWRLEDFEKFRRHVEEKKSLGPGFKVEELDKVILSDDNRKSIVSVLKQHQHSRKIFTDWGLGEVIPYGRGMTMLFHGPPGTGKTWAAECIAKAMGKKIKIIDSAQVQSSEPGGMERALQAIFEEAKKNKEIIFIDEADSMIQDRSGMGQIMSAENNCLLKEVEKFEGILILATNRIDELDKALERRISLICEFPEPNEEQRRQIWKRFLPEKMPLGEGVTPDVLAVHELTGGFIKNAVLGAARLAVTDDSEVVTMEHFEASITQIRKSNKAFAGQSKILHGIIKKGIQNGMLRKAVDRGMTIEKTMDVGEADKIIEAAAPVRSKRGKDNSPVPTET